MAAPATGVARDSATGLPEASARPKAPQPDRIAIAASSVCVGGCCRCHFCDGLIRLLELDYGVDVEVFKGRKTLHFHTLCYEQWLIEAAAIEP